MKEIQGYKMSKVGGKEKEREGREKLAQGLPTPNRLNGHRPKTRDGSWM